MSISSWEGPTSWWVYSTWMPSCSSASTVSRRTSEPASSVVRSKYPPSSSTSVERESRNRKYSSSGPTLNVSKPIACARSSARRSTWRGSPSYGVRSGVITSQNIRPTPCSSGRQGSTANVDGSGIAIMSDSSIALNPVIEDPSKPMPASNASSSSATLIENDFSCPRLWVNQKRMNLMWRSCTSALTSSGVFGCSDNGSVPGDRRDEVRDLLSFSALIQQ